VKLGNLAQVALVVKGVQKTNSPFFEKKLAPWQRLFKKNNPPWQIVSTFTGCQLE
jgi:hypothetical protein